MLITVLGLFTCLQLFYITLQKKVYNIKGVTNILSFLVFSFFILLFFFKNDQFGADTKNYITEFTSYCLSPNAYSGLDYTYKIIFDAINLLMLGDCNVNSLMWVWPLFVVGVTYYTCLHFKIEKIYVIALFTSFIGVELLSNAMRQGFSLAILIFSFCFYINKRYVYFVFFAGVSILFHQASILIIFIFLVSRIDYRLLIPGVLSGVFLVFNTNYFDFLPGLTGFRHSILRYLPFADDDFIVRVISFTNLLLLFFLFLFFMKKRYVFSKPCINVFINVVFICLLLSLVPYLGFRVIYGVYPLFLLMAYHELKIINNSGYYFLSLATIVNCLITILWLCGSSYMRSLPFVKLI